jgi:hypothetical protein
MKRRLRKQAATIENSSHPALAPVTGENTGNSHAFGIMFQWVTLSTDSALFTLLN